MFISFWIFAPGFESFVENFRCMHISVAEARKLTVVDFFFSFRCEVFSVI